MLISSIATPKNGIKLGKKISGVIVRTKPVANPELWGEILPYFKRRSFHFEKVKGHADNYYNNLVDEMAQKAASNITRRSV